jgi:hypothetical protein
MLSALIVVMDIHSVGGRCRLALMAERNELNIFATLATFGLTSWFLIISKTLKQARKHLHMPESWQRKGSYEQRTN